MILLYFISDRGHIYFLECFIEIYGPKMIQGNEFPCFIFVS